MNKQSNSWGERPTALDLDKLGDSEKINKPEKALDGNNLTKKYHTISVSDIKMIPGEREPELEKLKQAQKDVYETTSIEGLSKEGRRENLNTFLDTLLPYSEIILQPKLGENAEKRETISGEQIKDRVLTYIDRSPSAPSLQDNLLPIFNIIGLPDFEFQLEILILETLKTIIIPIEAVSLASKVPDADNDVDNKVQPFKDPLHVQWVQQETEKKLNKQPNPVMRPFVRPSLGTQLRRFFGLNASNVGKPDQIKTIFDKNLKKINLKNLPVLRDVVDETTPSNSIYKAVSQPRPDDDLDEPQTLRGNLQEKIGNWKERLGKVTKTTKNKLETTLDKMGPEGKKLVSMFTKGSEYLNSKVDKKTKFFAAAGLLSAGAMAAYATPVVLASIAGVGLSMRIISAAGVYTFARKELDKKYEEWEKDGKKKSALTIVGMEAGAVGFALFSGEVIGTLFQGIAEMSVVQETLTSIKNVANIDSLAEYWKGVFSDNVPAPTSVSTPSAESTPTILATAPEASTSGGDVSKTSPLESQTTPTNPDLEHTVKKGDTRWSLLRKDLEILQPEGFENLSQGGKERLIREILDDITDPPGNIDKILPIHPGDKISHNGIDFAAHIAKILKK